MFDVSSEWVVQVEEFFKQNTVSRIVLKNYENNSFTRRRELLSSRLSIFIKFPSVESAQL